MTSHTTDHTAPTSPETLSPTTLIGVFTDKHRQILIHYLIETPDTATVTDIAEHLASSGQQDETVPRELITQHLLCLYHMHLPYLADIGLIDYDSRKETVRLRISPDALRPYRDLLSMPVTTDC